MSLFSAKDLSPATEVWGGTPPSVPHRKPGVSTLMTNVFRNSKPVTYSFPLISHENFRLVRVWQKRFGEAMCKTRFLLQVGSSVCWRLPKEKGDDTNTNSNSARCDIDTIYSVNEVTFYQDKWNHKQKTFTNKQNHERIGTHVDINPNVSKN